MVLRDFPRLEFKRDLFLSFEQVYNILAVTNEFMIGKIPSLNRKDNMTIIFSSKRLENILKVYLNEILELNIQTVEVIKKFFKGIGSENS